jgi:hypothetical protein
VRLCAWALSVLAHSRYQITKNSYQLPHRRQYKFIVIFLLPRARPPVNHQQHLSTHAIAIQNENIIARMEADKTHTK